MATENRILKQNKIPGCERLTRPEEIKALSKYLRNIRETLEENTDLEETSLEIPGKTTGQIHDISELPQGKETLDPNHTIDVLETERLDLEDNRIPNLSTYREGLEDKRNPSLSDYRENLEDNREIELEDYKDELEDKRETELPNYQDKLEDKRDTVLSDFREDLEDSRDISLNDYKDTLEDSREQKLSDFRDDIEDTRNVELNDYKDSITDEREPKLSDHREIISDIPEPELPGTVKELGGDSRVISSLPDFKDSIADDRDTTLSDYKDTLTDTREPELSDYKDTIEDTRDPELRDTRLDILDEREPELSDVRLDVQDDRNLELPDTRLGLEDTRENALSDFRDDLTNERENSLSDYQESFAGEVNEVESLYDDVLGLDDPREPELSDHIENLEDDREPELEDFQDTLTDDRKPELSDIILDLEDDRENTLSDFLDNLIDDRESELSNTIIERPDNNEEEARVDGVFSNNEWNTDGSPGYYGSFDNVIPKLVDDREPELEDTIIKKDATYNPETSTFSTDGVARVDGDYDYIDNSVDYVNANPIIQLKAKNKFEAHQKVIDRPDNNEEEARVDGVFPNNEWNTDGSPGYYGSFDNVIPKIEGINEVESLYDTIIGLDNNYNPETGTTSTDGVARTDGDYDYIDNSVDYVNANPIIQLKAKNKFEAHQKVIEKSDNGNQNPIYEALNNLDEQGLYNFILQLLNDQQNDSDLEIDAEWREKIESLISTYLNPGEENKPIAPRNAHRFEDELFRSINVFDDSVEGGVRELQYHLGRNSDGTARIDGEYDFIDSTNTTQSRLDTHTVDEYKDVPLSEIPQSSTELMIEYIRYAAEQSVGMVNDRTMRKYLLDEVLWTLILTRRITEKTAEINRDRLPGHSDIGTGNIGTLIDEIYRAIQNGSIINSATNFIARYIKEKPNPINRPGKNPTTGEKYDTYYFNSANSRYNKNQNEGTAGVFKNLWNRIVSNLSGEQSLGDNNYYFFGDSYLSGGGIQTTLKDLCDCKSLNFSEWSVEDLLDVLKNSPYITTPSKFGTIHEGSYGTQTLDSNAYWEVIIEPFCDHYLNGGYSYLPCFNEINVINSTAHGVQTAYNKWVPISNFELQKAKLTTKSINLYDGEFSIPVSSELTNEIRFTIVDDQYKSWRNYFQKCMDVAVYSSEPHDENYYKNGGGISSSYMLDLPKVITPVDKSVVCVAFYKNITFRIRIYIMTPQYSTIRRFDLLCVLKDFSEEYSGDIDSGGVDLNVTFSIVGENPEGANEDSVGKKYLNNLSEEFYVDNLPEIPDYDEPDLMGRIHTIEE